MLDLEVATGLTLSEREVWPGGDVSRDFIGRTNGDGSEIQTRATAKIPYSFICFHAILRILKASINRTSEITRTGTWKASAISSVE
jgi:hypothetical protein